METKTFELNETSIPSQLGINLMDNNSFTFIESRAADMYRIVFASIADVLKNHQDKNKEKIGFAMKDDKGNFKLGGILNYQKPEEGEEEDSGNWYLEFTLNPEDMVDVVEEYDNHSDEFVLWAAKEADNIASCRFTTTEYMYIIFNTAIDTLIDFLDANASDTDEIQVMLRGVFTASVAIEDGKKVMSIVPGEFVKQIIKSDRIL